MPEDVVREELETGHVSRESDSSAPGTVTRNSPRTAP
jgi:hypothetical protein